MTLTVTHCLNRNFGNSTYFCIFKVHFAMMIKNWDFSHYKSKKRGLIDQLKSLLAFKNDENQTIIPKLPKSQYWLNISCSQVTFQDDWVSKCFQALRKAAHVLRLKMNCHEYSWQHINESKVLHTYVLNEFLPASHSR